MAQKHYVDNKQLYKAMVKYKAALNKHRRSPKKIPPPDIPEYIGECLLMIANRLSNKPNFASYTFREDMISDSIENCLLYMHNFDPKKSQNPFAYFTQIIHYAFIRRIEREKKYSYTKYKFALHKVQQHQDYISSDEAVHDIKDPAWTSYENIHEFIRGYEEKLNRPRPSRTSVADENEDDDIVSFDILEDDVDSDDEELALDGESETTILDVDEDEE